ncbi:hypothetical protein ACETIH_18100 [Microvirga arabica]|uniref:Uncharacterized protein n=1 Tax=Microvirga arabica TaxID=1128671 RepID=A0ABV6YBB7_9HYPH
MHTRFIAAMATALIVSGSPAAYAQSRNQGDGQASGNQNLSLNPNSGPTIQGNQPGASRSDQRAMLRRELRQAGFRNIRILDAAFLVQARNRNGDQVVMIINPPGSGGVSTTSNQVTTGSTGQDDSYGFNTPTRYGSPRYTPPDSIPQFGNMNNQNNPN